ncbi:MAG: prepilin-type N-terminal cleavage/methylation domain-containing protein [Planctomycetota bacterium]
MHPQTCLYNYRCFKNNAFTIVELLVVISIIALLVAILLPVLGQAREAAVNAKCLSNLRQIGTALNVYATDNGEYKTYAGDIKTTPTGGTADFRVSPNQNIFAHFNKGGALGRAWFYPELLKEGYISDLEVGFCPNNWETDFTYVANNTMGHPQFVEDGGPADFVGGIDFQIGYGGTGGAHRGEYLYFGPYTQTWIWQKRFVSPQLISRYVAGDNLWTWGTRYDGTTAPLTNVNGVDDRFTNNPRMPLFGEGAKQVSGSVYTTTHFGSPKSNFDFAANGGALNYFFTDGSGETLPYSE